MIRLAFFLILTTVCTLYALWKGGAPEKAAASIFLYGAISTIALQGPIETRFLHLEVGIFIVDLTVLVALVVLALNAERYWPIWFAAFQVIQALSHVPRILMPQMVPEAYIEIVAIWCYPMLVILAVGTWRHQDRLRRYGRDRSWSDFSPLR